MNETSATVKKRNGGKRRSKSPAASHTVKFTSMRTSQDSRLSPNAEGCNESSSEECAVTFIRMNETMNRDEEEGERTPMPGGAHHKHEFGEAVAQSDAMTAVSRPVAIKTSRSEQKLDVSDCDSDSLASSLGVIEADVSGSSSRRGFLVDKLTSQRFKSSDSRFSGSSSFNTRLSPSMRSTSDKDSVGSNESAGKHEKSKIASIIDKAKSKGRKLVSSSKSKKTTEPEVAEEASQVMLIGTDEAVASASNVADRDSIYSASHSNGGQSESSLLSWVSWDTLRMAAQTSPDRPFIFHSLAVRCRTLPFFRHRVVLFVLLVSITCVLPGFVTGFFWGMYLSFVGFLYLFVSDPLRDDRPPVQLPTDVALGFSGDIDESKAINTSIYKGWINELRGRYDPATYHVNSAQTVLVRLDGPMLRVSRPERAVLKHSFHTDPTLTEPEPTICGQSIYDLTGAVVSLRPKRLAVRRWWSRKYPIHIRLSSVQSELSTIDSSMQRSQSLFQQINKTASESSVTRSDSLESPKLRGNSKEKDSAEVSEARDQDYYPDDGSDEDDEPGAPVTKVGRANSVGDLADFGGTSEYNRRALKPRGRSLYFFVRSAREKERWFHRLREACSQYRKRISDCDPSEKDVFGSDTASARSEELERPSLVAPRNRRCSLPQISEATVADAINLEHLLYISNHAQFHKLMVEVMGLSKMASQSSGVVCMDLGRNKWTPGTHAGSELVRSANILAARIFYDFCRDSYWCRQVQEKIQSKLATIHLPFFIETLELSRLDLGSTAPQIVSVYSPILDEWGLWIDFDLNYGGGLHLVLETRVNLMKLKNGFQRVEAQRKMSKITSSVLAHHYSDEDLPESPESSPDEDFGSKTEKCSTKERTGKKLLSMVDKIASSKYFQGASELKPVKKMMEEISSTRLMLNVEVTHLEGTMAINIPAPPSDRLWYAFRRPPKISIRSVPQVGDRSVDMSTVSDWIENKLRLLLEKNLVCPNMDDIVVPVMSGNHLLKGGYNK